MDPLAGLDGDEHEDFFRRHEAEQEFQSLAAFEAEGDEPPPLSREQLAHFKRFHKLVALFMGAMAVLSFAGLALRSSQPTQAPLVASAAHARRALVAQYTAAIPAAVPPVPLASAASVVPYQPVEWAAVSPAPRMCLLDPNAESAWLHVSLAEPASVEGSAVRLSHAGSARVRRPTATSSIGTHVTVSARAIAASARVAPVAATRSAAVRPRVAAAPAAALPSFVAPAPLSSVARFPDPG